MLVTVTEDGTSPGATTGTGNSPTITSASFTPAAGRLVVALVSAEWSRNTITEVVSDSRGHTWQLMALARGTGTWRGLSAVYCTWVTTSAAMTVTATFTGLNGGGRFLDVRVLNGADPAQSPSTGWALVRTTAATNTGRMIIDTTAVGSLVYGISSTPQNVNSITAVAGTTIIGQHVNITDNAAAASWKTTATTSPGSVLVGGTWAVAGHGNIAAFEVIPLGGGDSSPTMPTFVDGMVPRAADLNALALNIRNLYGVAGGGQRYAPYVAGGKGPVKPLTILGITNPAFGAGSSSLTYMVWDTPYVNSDNAWNPLAPSLLYIHTAGLYRLHFQVQALSIAPTEFETFILVNGTSTSTYAVAAANAYGTACGCSVSLRLSAGAVVYCAMVQFSGGVATMGATQFVAEFLSA